MQLFAIFTAAIFVLQIFAQDANITASTCVSPGGFSACYDSAASIFNKCVVEANSDTTGFVVCSCELLIKELDCALSNCWNVVYGCEYQSVANLVAGYCFGKDIPFFPAPENAPGGCSCNLGYVLNNITAVVEQYNSCVVQAGADFELLGQCNCCEQSGVYTSKYSICPNTNPSLNGLPGDTDIFQFYQPQFENCGSDFARSNCVRDLGFPDIGSLSYLSAPPASTGTETLSNLAGTVANPPMGSTFTWVGGSTVITAAQMTGSAAPSTTTSGTMRMDATRYMHLITAVSLLVVFL